MTENDNTTNKTFEGLGISPKVLQILSSLNFTSPTPVQEKTIPIALTGKDVIGIAQTGTGKTLAFTIPIIHRISETKGKALVLLPTRELAVQVEETLRMVGKPLGLKTAVLIGGQSMFKQISDLRRDPHVVIATPGRLNDHLRQKSIRLDKVNALVLDEADRMLDMGFAPQIQEILKSVPDTRQTLLFSATMPPEIAAITKNYMKSPDTIEVTPPGTNNHLISQEVFFIDTPQRIPLLKKHLDTFSGKILVFTRTKHGAKKVATVVRSLGHKSSEIHSNRTLSQRMIAMEGFKRGDFRVLVATDIAARGIDVKNIDLVINYDLPDNAEDYVHRIGRTGRAESKGHAVSYAHHSQKRDVKIIERLIRKSLPVAKIPELEKVVIATTEKDAYETERPQRSNFNPRSRGNRDRSSSTPSSFRGFRGRDRSQPSTPEFRDFRSKSRPLASRTTFRKSRTF